MLKCRAGFFGACVGSVIGRGDVERNVDQRLEQGAIGMSSGLCYAVANAATTDEAAAGAKPLGNWGGQYTPHMPDDGDSILKASHDTDQTSPRPGATLIVPSHTRDPPPATVPP